MPGAVAAWVSTYVFGSAALAGTTLATASAVASIAAGFAYVGTVLGITAALGKVSEALMGRPRGLGGPSSREMVIKTTTAPRGFVYGEVTCGGTLVFMGTTGVKNEWLDFVIAVAGHQVESITDVWFDDEKIANSAIAGGSAAGGGVTSGAFSPHEGRTVAYVYKYLGTSAQTASSILAGGFPDGYEEWTTDHRLRGCAYVHIRLRRDAKRYENGPPQTFRFRVKGAKVYDPRLDSTNGGLGDQRYYDATTWTWSNNPALCVADYIVGGTIVNDDATPVRKRGFGAAISDVDWSTVIAAANVCDEDVAIPPEGSPSSFHNRYELDGIVYPSDGMPDADCLEQLLTSMLGQVVLTGGQYRVYSGVYETAAHTINEDDLAGTVQFVTAQGRSERYNTVRGTRYDDTQGQMVEFLSRTAQSYVDADGRSLYHDIELPTTINEWRAQRIAQVILRRSREQKTLVWQGKLSCARIAVWETVEVTCAELGLDGKVFRCINRAIRSNSDEALVELTLREENATTYSDPYLTDYDSITVSDDPGPAAGSLDEPTAFTATPMTGGILFEITPDISTPTDAVYEIVEYSASTPVESASLIWTGAMTKVAYPFPSTSPVHSGYFWVRARRNAATSSYFPVGAGVYGIAAEGTQGPPGQDGTDGADGAPQLSVLLSNPHATLVAYADGTVADYSTADGYFRVFAGGVEITNSVTYSVTAAAGCTGTINTAAGVPVGGEPIGYYRVTNMSTNEASLALRASYGGVDYDVLFTLTKALAGYQIVAALPSTNLFDGRIVYLTTDGKLYRYVGTPGSGGAWTAMVPATDISGQVVAAQLAADSVTAEQLAPGSITAPALLIRGGGAALNLDPDMRDASAWLAEYTEPTFTTVSDGKVGNNVARSPGSYVGFRSRQLIPFDPAKAYRIRGWARTYSGGGGLFYLGVALQDVNGANITGDGTYWSYGAASAVTLPNAWTAYSAVFGAGTAKPFPSNAKTMAVLALLSYNGSTYHEVQDLRIEELTPSTLIMDGAITTAKIVAGAITATEIATNAITAGKIAANAIVADNIQAGQVTAAKMATGTITAVSGILGDLCVQTAKIEDLAVGTIKIANGAVTEAALLEFGGGDVEVVGPYQSVLETYTDLILGGVLMQVTVFNAPAVDGKVIIGGFFNAMRHGSDGETVRLRMVRTSDGIVINGNPTIRLNQTRRTDSWEFNDRYPPAGTSTYKVQICRAAGSGSGYDGDWFSVLLTAVIYKK